MHVPTHFHAFRTKAASSTANGDLSVIGECHVHSSNEFLVHLQINDDKSENNAKTYTSSKSCGPGHGRYEKMEASGRDWLQYEYIFLKSLITNEWMKNQILGLFLCTILAESRPSNHLDMSLITCIWTVVIQNKVTNKY